MQQKLTKEQQDQILNIAIKAFADKGISEVSVQEIAREAGVSVGVIYKYYGSKMELFEACFERALRMLDHVIQHSIKTHDSINDIARQLLKTCVRLSSEEPQYVQMYHLLTVTGDAEMRKSNADAIETISATKYVKLIQEAQEEGRIRDDIPADILAFFFDNMLMMLHFSVACDYYKERFRIYCPDRSLKDEIFIENLLKLLEGSAINNEADDSSKL